MNAVKVCLARSFAVLALASYPVLLPQPVAGQAEVAVFGGGVRISDVGTNPAAGGSIGGKVSNRILALGELSYYGAGGEKAAFGVPGELRVTGDVSGKILDFNGGLHVNLTSGDSKAVPYVAVGAGVGRASVSGKVVTTVGRTTTTIAFDESDSSFAFNGGIGLRYHVTESWGFRPEFKVIRYTKEGGATALRFTIGIFYQFGR